MIIIHRLNTLFYNTLYSIKYITINDMHFKVLRVTFLYNLYSFSKAFAWNRVHLIFSKHFVKGNATNNLLCVRQLEYFLTGEWNESFPLTLGLSREHSLPGLFVLLVSVSLVYTCTFPWFHIPIGAIITSKYRLYNFDI